mgnify:FL=1
MSRISFKEWLYSKYCYSYTDKTKLEELKKYFDEALKKASKHPQFRKNLDYPCGECNGKGSISVAMGPYDYDDENCQGCNGHGFVAKQIYKDKFVIFQSEEKEKNARLAAIKKELTRIKKKLTKKEE